jgi:hypothetical protein
MGEMFSRAFADEYISLSSERLIYSRTSVIEQNSKKD